MFSLIQQYLQRSELVEVEPHEAILSNVAYQPEDQRVILQLLNYRQDLAQQLHIQVRAPVTKVEILSPDSLADTRAKVQVQGQDWEIIVPELRTYDLVAIYLNGRVDATHGIR
jgi:hypothetical protein